MNAICRVMLVCALVSLAACGGGGGGGGGGLTDTVTPNADNVVPIAVNGALGFVNLPYVTVTVCAPGTASCATIDNVLLDTGSAGLRVLASAVSALNLAQQTNAGSLPLFNCAQFVDLSHAWGAVRIADVKIGGKTASSINIQTIGGANAEPAACGTAADNLDTPQKLGANGILGVGHWLQDCGAYCETTLVNTFYYACTGGTCADTLASAAQQVQNPAARFASDNNGAIVQLPAVSAAGAANVAGSLIFGIGTRSNNALGSARKFLLGNSGYITTRFNNVDYPRSFVDSGSNGLFFPNTLPIPTCSSSADFYCPSSTLSLSAIMSGAIGSSPAATIGFNVANTEALNLNNDAFSNLGGVYADGFDWGLPFFFGRNVYTAFENDAGGPYVAF